MDDVGDHRCTRFTEASSDEDPLAPIDFSASVPKDAGMAYAFAQTVAALQRASLWRWAFVARVVRGGKAAQILAFTDRGRRVHGMTYRLMDTPCGLLAETPGVLHVSDAVVLAPTEI